MKRVFLACGAVVFLFGISSVSFASGKGDDMKGKGEEMSTGVKGKTKGNEKGKPKKEPKKEPVEK